MESLGEYRGLGNPFTDWLHGVFRLATGEANRASNLLRDAVAVDGRRNRHALAGFVVAERIAQGGKAESDRDPRVTDRCAVLHARLCGDPDFERNSRPRRTLTATECCTESPNSPPRSAAPARWQRH